MPRLEKIKETLDKVPKSGSGSSKGTVRGDKNIDFDLPITTFRFHEDDDVGEGYIIVHSVKLDTESQPVITRVFLALSNKITNGRHYYTDNESILDISYSDTPALDQPEQMFKGVNDPASYIDIEFKRQEGTLVASVHNIKLKRTGTEEEAVINADINAQHLDQARS